MHGSLALARGTLLVGLQAKTAHVLVLDLGGRVLAPGWSFREHSSGRSSAAGMAIDDDRQVWIADAPNDRVRVFSIFGREVGGLGEPASDGATPVLPGLIQMPVDVDVHGHRDGGTVVVACGGERRHAVQLFEPDGTFRRSCAALGDPLGTFRRVVRVALDGSRLLVAEAGGRTVQVFRDGEFHFAYRVGARRGEHFEPSALAAVGDGRAVLACRSPESALFLVDAAGSVIRTLASEGNDGGQVSDPCDLVLEPGGDDRRARLFVLDRDGLRLQVFTLEGACHGAIPIEAFPRRRSAPDQGRRPPEKQGGR